MPEADDNMITFTLDGEEITVPEGTTLLEAARMIGKEIPVICYHDATTANGLCRVCVVDVNGGRLLQPACIAECQHDSIVETRNERVERNRRTILEMLNSAVDLSQGEAIQEMMMDYGVDESRFPDAKRREHDIHDDNPFYVRDYNQCVLCWRCVQVCAEDAQYTFALTLGERGYDTHVATAFDIGMMDSPCVFCGQCIGVCPTGALKPKTEWGLEQGMSPDEIRQMTRIPRRRKENTE
ncbi:MAG: 4Fe-4S dicluster domain-containing protein [Chloroflexi bacterium]|nr:MAG: Fe-S-binding domain-containing protein [Phototrophicales bacterium]RMF79697.1 MAG: 4Fe-4S dicluster domain-containing protein [Chloroflexota bacterium]